MLPAERLWEFLLGRAGLHPKRVGWGSCPDRGRQTKSMSGGRCWNVVYQWTRGDVIFKDWGDEWTIFEIYVLDYFHKFFIINRLPGGTLLKQESLK